jgi:hypothetical protein
MRVLIRQAIQSAQLRYEKRCRMPRLAPEKPKAASYPRQVDKTTEKSVKPMRFWQWSLERPWRLNAIDRRDSGSTPSVAIRRP